MSAATPLRPVASNALPFERPIYLPSLPGPPPFPPLSEHRPTEAVHRLLAESLLDGEHGLGLVPVDEPSAHRRLARQPPAQILEETGIDTDIGPYSHLSFFQKDVVEPPVWRICGAFPLARRIVRR